MTNLRLFSHFSLGLSVAANVKSQIYRGLVEHYDPETKVAKLRQVDVGKTAVVPIDDLWELPNLLRKINQVRTDNL
jgi:hypothetical protein